METWARNIGKGIIILFILLVAYLIKPANAEEHSIFSETNDLHNNLIDKEKSPGLYCLAQNIYHEAKSESTVGQVAVALVVLNRIESVRYPDNICDVVYQGPVRESWKTRENKDLADSERKYYPIRNKCQFSWYCDGKADVQREDVAWRKAQEIAYRVGVLGQYRGLVEGATHYHATYVSPSWSKELYFIGRVDSHLFYRTDHIDK
jgi:spore germination cell wall hydrolase CwlJ-like protein